MDQTRNQLGGALAALAVLASFSCGESPAGDAPDADVSCADCFGPDASSSDAGLQVHDGGSTRDAGGSSRDGGSSHDGGSSAKDAGGPAPDAGATAALRFAFTGDTRPDKCDDFANYPSSVMQSIVAGMRSHQVGFALDTGDHLKVCKTDTPSQASSSAGQQLQTYRNATAALGAPFYLTMGNHECFDNKALCDVTDPVLSIFMTYINKARSTLTPYYTFDLPTPRGAATFVFLADTAWGPDEANWLEATLSHGDSSAYTVIAKHVPANDTAFLNGEEMPIIERHKFSLLLDAHTHQYLAGGEGGREFTLGLGGAPLANVGDDYGYGLVEQQGDGTLKVTVYGVTTGMPIDTKVVNPN